MKHIAQIFNHNKISHWLVGIFALFIIFDFPHQAICASVSRANTSRTAPAKKGTRMASTSSMNTSPTTPSSVSTDTDEASAQTDNIDEIEQEEQLIIEDKSSDFSASMSVFGNSDVSSAGISTMASLIMRQREMLDAQSSATTGGTQTLTATSCDKNLRKCMQEKCGTDFLKCKSDGDTEWGEKIDSCQRHATKCTAHEVALLAPEIKADRDYNLLTELFDKTIKCGMSYNSCMEQECGVALTKCLGKSAEDSAIAKCQKIATECKEYDNGLASRTRSAISTLRQDAEVQAKEDEETLYTLRDQMSDTCVYAGAIFDTRSLDCVFTVNFFGGDDLTTPKASKKVYAGSGFDCTPDWFGIDITTFKENAYRLTREQTSASSAMLGSGVGMLAGAASSGALSRSIDTHNAKKELKNAESENKEVDVANAKTKEACEKAGGEWSGNNCYMSKNKNYRKEKKQIKTTEKKSAISAATTKDDCTEAGGRWANNECHERGSEDLKTAKTEDKKKECTTNNKVWSDTLKKCFANTTQQWEAERKQAPSKEACVKIGASPNTNYWSDCLGKCFENITKGTAAEQKNPEECSSEGGGVTQPQEQKTQEIIQEINQNLNRKIREL